MGVEPTRDRAERPPSRFEDGETHRGPYTSISVAVLCHLYYLPVKPANAPAPCPPPLRTLPSTRPPVSQGDHDSPLPRHTRPACTPATASSITRHCPGLVPN